MKLTKLKSNKGITLQDAAIAIIVIVLFVGTIVGFYISIYKIQAGTKVDSIAMLYVVQIMERIDKLGFDEVQENKLTSIENSVRKDFNISDRFNINIEIVPDEVTDNLVKTVKLTLSYNFLNKDRTIVISSLKVKEFEGES